MAKKIAEIRKGHCPQCGPNRSADIMGLYEETWSNEEDHTWGGTDYYILKCRGCDAPFYQTDEYDSDDHYNWMDENGDIHTNEQRRITHWPSPIKREQPKWAMTISRIDADLGSLFEDIYGALNAELKVPAAISIRTALDRASELLGVDPAITFEEKMQELLTGGKISQDEKQTLGVLVDAGSAAAHRGWRPGLGELDTMMSLMEGFLHRTFVLGDAAKKLQKSIPPKPKRKSKSPETPPSPAPPK